MADDETAQPEQQDGQGQFRLTIIMDANGGIRLDGSIGNLYLAYGALELAKDALRNYHAEKNAPRIHQSVGSPFPFRRPRNGG